MVRLGPLRPVQDDVRRRHQFHLHYARVDRVLAGQQRFHPDALAPALDEIAVRERVTRHILVLAPDIAYDHAYVADRDLGEHDRFDTHEPRIQVPRTRQQHLLLQTATAARVDERLPALEAVVTFDDGTGQVTRRNRPAVEHRHDADTIGRELKDVQLAGHHPEFGGPVRRHHFEQRRVDAVRTRGQKRDLTAALAVAAQERFRILIVVARHRTRQHAFRRNRLAVGRDDERDLPGLHDLDRHLHDLVAPAPESQVPPRG